MAPVLSPPLPEEEEEGEGEEVLVPVVAVLLDVGVLLDVVDVDAIDEEVAVNGKAFQSSGATAWKVSSVGVPLHPSPPQQCHSC